MKAFLKQPAALRLFGVSFLILFFELAYIRWLAGYVSFFSYFPNLVLMGSFVGMSLGMLAARHSRVLLPYSLGAGLGIVLLTALLAVFRKALGDFPLFGKRPEAVVLEGLTQSLGNIVNIIPMEVILGLYYFLVAVAFLGMGQRLAQEFQHFPALLAYCINIAGSLAGVVAFAIISWTQLPAPLWFFLGGLGIVWLWFGGFTLLALTSTVLAIWLMEFNPLIGRLFGSETFWSPYYRIRLTNDVLMANEIGHQVMVTVERLQVWGYDWPYLLRRAAGESDFQGVLIIGAGSGNDVAMARHYGARQIDAVEIDPLIREIGAARHPARAYQGEEVRTYVDDGRSFLRRHDQKYDLIVYGLIDSVRLLSGYSSIRLETYLYTKEAFEDVKRRLGGSAVFAVLTNINPPWLNERLSATLQEVFRQEPLHLVPKGSPKTWEDFRLHWYLVGDIDGLRRIVSRGEWPFEARSAPLEEKPALATDDWPFYYLRSNVIPVQNLSTLAVVLGVSLALLTLLGPRLPPRRMTLQMFLLGAAFLLLETKSVTTAALVFGSTWVVNAFVFSVVLVLILLANLWVLGRPTIPLNPIYGLLMAALFLGYALPPNQFLGLSFLPRAVLATAVILLPILFAGIVFATLFRTSESPYEDLAANIAGAVVGGVLENVSLLVGYQNLILLVGALYLLSWSLRWTSGRALGSSA